MKNGRWMTSRRLKERKTERNEKRKIGQKERKKQKKKLDIYPRIMIQYKCKINYYPTQSSKRDVL